MYKKTCTTCGHKCHCDKLNCPDCINDVCVHCKCEDKTLTEYEAKIWPWQDSGCENFV